MDDYIFGITGIAKYFKLPVYTIVQLLSRGGIPGVVKLKRRISQNFAGGGRGVWALKRFLAEHYRSERVKTPQYDPKLVTERLLIRFSFTKCENIPELIGYGFLTDTDWCEALNEERFNCRLNVPIMMNPLDLAEYLGTSPLKTGLIEHKRATRAIFKLVRSKNDRTREPLASEAPETDGSEAKFSFS